MEDPAVKTRPARRAQQRSILFDRKCYSAFPHVIRLEGDELLMTFRQAPRQDTIHHTHPRSIITCVRSYDAGRAWDFENATQFAAGGGQEFAPIYLGQGKIAGALAWHKIAPMHEGPRAGVPKIHAGEYPFDTPGPYWAHSDNLGFNWLPHHVQLLDNAGMPCAPPIRTHDGALLCPYYTWNRGSPFMWSALVTSHDGGVTWSRPGVIARDPDNIRAFCEPAIIETQPGRLRAMHRCEGPDAEAHGRFWTNESHDGGKTWSTPVNTGILSGACPRLLKLVDGRLLLTFGRRPEPCAIRAMVSGDGGRTWGDRAWIIRRCRNSDQGYTSTIELSPGRLFTATYAQNTAGVTGIAGTFWELA